MIEGTMLCRSQGYPRKPLSIQSPTIISGLEAQKTRLIVSFYTRLSPRPAGESAVDGLLVSCQAWEIK